MKTYIVTETYTVTRRVRVLAPDLETAKTWDVHPDVFILDSDTPKDSDFKLTAEEEK